MKLEGYIHRGITCNKCNVSPIRGVRYKCANCVDFDLCEMCESGNTHTATHVFLKIRIPIPPLANPRSALLPAFYPGKNNIRWSLTTDKIRELQQRSHFDQVELEALYDQFKSLATVDKSEDGSGIDKDTFEQCLGPLGLEKNLITERIFDFFDQDHDGVINFSELVAGLSILCKGNLDEKMEYAFKGYDLDEDGFLSRDELYQMFKSYFYLSMELVRDVVSAMEDEMMDTFEFSASQPVSSAFNVAMPSSSPGDGSESSSGSGTDSDETSSGSVAGPSSSRRTHRKRRYPHKEDHFEKLYARSKQQWEEAQALTDAFQADEYDRSMRKNKQRSTALGLSNEADYDDVDDQIPKKTWEEKFPIMETMSQDAINEMVDRTFKTAKPKRKGYIDFDEFRQCVQTDSSIVSWFEALGTVF
ncbi:hypothetical protein BCR43DRAFT_269943 [Syncephalastrum racemosum]|uniref:EF-hand n=1 Tax=Syncephalastrum racemosum TaxID=13706 RepID=A0A1X2HBS1_SYNRA|nr:hypothetical protein BCR43DRAFT_269943 [Syncephalastrum racemosum]